MSPAPFDLVEDLGLYEPEETVEDLRRQEGCRPRPDAIDWSDLIKDHIEEERCRRT
jgi:hypothetical protein